MTKQVDVDTLRTWLDEHRPVTVLDIRPEDERAQWAIPGSIHVDAYESVRNGEPGPLATVALPADRPVVAVCGAGRTSLAAAEMLSARGLDARSLTGGMKAWSLSWNTADVPLAAETTRVVQVRRTGKGCLSYVAGSGDEAVVIDPSLPNEVYLDIARRHGWRIRHVLDTHVHADHLSRARSLSAAAGAILRLPAQRRVHFPFTAVADGDRIGFGEAVLSARRTPGHTDESTSFLLNGEAVFTGDTLFTNGVGRPDLKADVEGARLRAKALFASLTWLRSLGPDVLVLPGHAGEPVAFGPEAEAAHLRDIDGWLSEWLVSEPAFVDRLVSRLPPTPPNYTRIVELNEQGELPAGDPTDLEAGANHCAVA